MNDETCKCFECNKEIPSNMAHVVTRPSRYNGKVITYEMCDECWYFEGTNNDEE